MTGMARLGFAKSLPLLTLRPKGAPPMRILTTADATETAPYERTRMYSEPISPTDTDENGNAVSIDNSGQFRVTINGKNNVVKIANRTAGARVVVNIQGNNNTIEIGVVAEVPLGRLVPLSPAASGHAFDLGGAEFVEAVHECDADVDFGGLAVGVS